MIRSIKNLYHLLQAILANIWNGFPSRKIKVIGVTGTDGKTTTTHLIYHLLKLAGKKVSMISSVYADIGGKIYDTGFHTTTPGSFAIQRYLKMAVEHQDEFFVLETTAHGIDQKRVWGIDYSVAALTNITFEHINSVAGYDYFGTLDSYITTKTDLLLKAKQAIINLDEPAYEKVSKILRQKNKTFKTYSLNKKSDYTWSSEFQSNLVGDYNRSNILAAWAVLDILGIDKKNVTQGIKDFQLPQGRLETVYNRNFRIIIDFAHTINGVFQLLKAVRSELAGQSGRIIHVFGAAGFRDKDKRPLMGEASGEYADIVILTEEDYREEDPMDICQSIARGLEKKGFKKIQSSSLDHWTNKTYGVIVDRQEAIDKAISLARKGDLVIITGKGHEKSLCRGKIEYPWNEHEAVKKALKK